MIGRPLMVSLPIVSVLFISGLGLCACSSATNPLAQMKLAGQADDVCQQTGAGNGMAGPQAAYQACMQERYSNGQMGYSDGGHSMAGSYSTTLNQIGQ
jgi:putative hemolysin